MSEKKLLDGVVHYLETLNRFDAGVLVGILVGAYERRLQTPNAPFNPQDQDRLRAFLESTNAEPKINELVLNAHRVLSTTTVKPRDYTKKRILGALGRADKDDRTLFQDFEHAFLGTGPYRDRTEVTRHSICKNRASMIVQAALEKHGLRFFSLSERRALVSIVDPLTVRKLRMKLRTRKQ